MSLLEENFERFSADQQYISFSQLSFVKQRSIKRVAKIGITSPSIITANDSSIVTQGMSNRAKMSKVIRKASEVKKMEKKPIQIATTADKLQANSQVITPDRGRQRKVQTLASVGSASKQCKLKCSVDAKATLNSGCKTVHQTII